MDRAERAQEGGLFSAFTSYVSSFASDEPPEPSDKEIEDTLYTVDSIAACRLDKLFTTIRQVNGQSYWRQLANSTQSTAFCFT